ncbi:MAG: UDP-N-acetylmuramate dehydrogenase [bacterium]|nr:UDP-N-acetylmuramate dehydrogenase [bacterium]
MEKKNLGKRLEEKLPGVKKNILLKDYTTFKIGGRAKYFFIAQTKEDIILAVKTAKELNLPFFILGGGSNLLVSDKGFNGLIIKTENKKVDIKNSKVIVEAGMPLTKLASILANRGLTGLEWSAGIPGTVGGAIRGNAGAFGGSMSDAVKTVTILDYKDLNVKKMNNADCKFRYRDSIFKEKKFFILSAELKFKKEEEDKIKEKIKECLNYRKMRHPKNPSAGSTFKNVPIKIIPKIFFEEIPEAKKAIKENILPSAFLIAKAGLIGKKIGGALVSHEHPNFIVNCNNARAQDIKQLIRFIKKTIKNKFGVILEEEIMYLGF